MHIHEIHTNLVGVYLMTMHVCDRMRLVSLQRITVSASADIRFDQISYFSCAAFTVTLEAVGFVHRLGLLGLI